MLKIDDLRQLNPDELAEKVLQLKKEFFNLRVSAKSGKLEKNHQISDVKKDIARVLTIQNELAKSTGVKAEPKAAKKSPKAESKTADQKIEEVKKVVQKKVKAKETSKEEKPKRGLFGRKKKG